MKFIGILIIYILAVNQINAQPMPWDGAQPYPTKAVLERKPVPWHEVNEANVMYHWRVERIIDTRIKQNTPLQWPQNPLWNMIKTGLDANKLVAYKSDSLTNKLDLEQLYLKLNHKEIITLQKSAENPYDLIDTEIVVTYNWEDFKRFKIMEDWVFDKKESRMFCRICYIAPMYMPYAGGPAVPEQPAFYLKYYDPANKDDKCFRNVAVNSLVYNMKNESHKLTYDDFFEMRMFNSYLIKESNVFDDKFKDYEELKDDPIATMLRSEKASEDLMQKEMDNWEH